MNEKPESNVNVGSIIKLKECSVFPQLLHSLLYRRGECLTFYVSAAAVWKGMKKEVQLEKMISKIDKLKYSITMVFNFFAIFQAVTTNYPSDIIVKHQISYL